MDSNRNPGRVAGLWYLALVFLGPVRLIYIPDKLFVRGDATATAANIAAHETLFRLGMVADLLGAMVLVFVTLAFYRLFQSIDRYHAVSVIILGGVMPATLYLVNIANDAAALELVRGADYLGVFTKPQNDALALLFLHLHRHLITAAEILWGLWLFPLGILSYRSRVIPRFIGVWLIVNGFAYAIESIVGLALPQYSDVVGTYAFPAQLGELALVLWLLVRGARPREADGVD